MLIAACAAQCSLFINMIKLCLESIETDHVISESLHKGTFYKAIIGKLPFYGHLPIIPL